MTDLAAEQSCVAEISQPDFALPALDYAGRRVWQGSPTVTPALTDEPQPHRTWPSPREHPSMCCVETVSLYLSVWPMQSALDEE